MTNRQKYIESIRQKQKLKVTRERIYHDVPAIYAAFAICLFNRGWSAEEISDLFAETQAEWNDCTENDVDMCKKCSDLTDIDVIDRTQAKEYGVEEN